VGILGTAAAFIPVYGTAISVSVSGIMFVYNIYKGVQTSNEIDGTNQKLDEIVKDVDLNNDLLIMYAGASIATYQNAVTPYNVSVNERDLQISLCLYNNARPEEVDRATLLAEFYIKTKNGKETNLVWHFINWCSGKKAEINAHTLQLREELDKYRSANPQCPYHQIEHLTPEQIIELDKKFHDPVYNLVLE
jgi:hypothetical protein